MMRTRIEKVELDLRKIGHAGYASIFAILMGLISSTLTGCASTNTQQIWVLKNTETAIMNYAAIVPIKNPEGKYVANIFGEYGDRKYQFPMDQQFLNAYVKKLLEGDSNKLFVQEGVLVIRNIEGNKLQIGGTFDSNTGEVSIQSKGGVYLGTPDKPGGGLVTTMLGWIF